MTSGLKDAVCTHLERRELDEAQFRRLERLQQQGGARHRRYGAAAAFGVLLLSLGVLAYWVPSWVTTDLAREIASEVALNHLKRRPLEVHGAALAEVQPYFHELPFRLLDSSLLATSGLDLRGGRYCSVGGVSAAQLRLRDTQGGLQTLYQVPYDAEVFGGLPNLDAGALPKTLQVRGLSVDLWVERGLLFARVRE